MIRTARPNPFLAFLVATLLSLLALCVGLTVSAIAQRENETPAALLAQAVGLDMPSWWTPTAAGYFDHVSKAKALSTAASIHRKKSRKL